GGNWHPVSGAHRFSVQLSPSSQTSGVPAVQVPATQVSPPLHTLTSPHGVPSGAGAPATHPPPFGAHVSTPLHGLPSSQGWCVQCPPPQRSVVQGSVSAQAASEPPTPPSARSASRRPAPATSSNPDGAMSTAVSLRVAWIAAGVRLGFLCSMSAATAAVCGAAADVPKNGAKPGTAVVTPSKPAMSGFGRSLGVGNATRAGPCELYDWTLLRLSRPMAATVTASG